MSRIVVRGVGAVSPAGWGTATLRGAIARGLPLAIQDVAHRGHARVFKTRRVPSPETKPKFLGHPRLRRTSPIAQYAVAAALEALGPDASQFGNGASKLGIIYCSMAGCVNFSQRFYDETLKDPATASPVIFPETVFNAPASHLGALLGSSAMNYTLVGDPGTFLQALALGADWLANRQVDACVIVGAEELDWLVAHASGLFDPNAVISEGAGALYLKLEDQPSGAVELQAVTDSYLFCSKLARATAAAKARAEAGPIAGRALLCDGTQAVPRLDGDEENAWGGWPGSRLSPKRICGESFMAAAAWQCAVAVDSLTHGAYDNAYVSVVGCNQQAIAARFGKS